MVRFRVLQLLMHVVCTLRALLASCLDMRANARTHVLHCTYGHTAFDEEMGEDGQSK